VQPRRTGKKQFTETCRLVNQIPLRNSDDALMVNGFELVTTAQDHTMPFINARATSHRVTKDNVADLKLK